MMGRAVVIGVLLTALTVWAYQSTWSAGWVYEDRATVTTATQASGGWLAQRSVSLWTWRLTATPRAAHVVSLALHLLIGALIGVVAWRLGLTTLGAWAAATIWLLHPMTVETAAYAKARADEIAILGTLIAVLAATGPWWRGRHLLGIALGSLLAVGGKQAGVVVLLLVPLTVWHGRQRQGPRAPLWAPWWLPAVVAVEIAAGGVHWYGGLRSLINADGEAGLVSALDVTWVQWAFAQGGAVWYWLLSMVWPALLTPDADIDRLSMLARGMGVFTLLTVAGVAWRVRDRAPLVSLGCGWLVCGVLPRLLIQTPRSYLSAGQFTVAFIGLALLAGVGVQHLTRQWPSPSSADSCW